MFNFKWQPFSAGIKFGRLGHVDSHKRDDFKGGGLGEVQVATQDKIGQQMVNHFEYHHLITEKYNLLAVM